MGDNEDASQQFTNYSFFTHIQQLQDSRKISDPIHDFITFDKQVWKIIDTPVYQRLRNIKQLGTTSYVFSGANHTRFEHCLGVGHLAQRFIKNIYKNQPRVNNFSGSEREKQIQAITIAGVCHDLGHGPFSHMFDNLLIPKIAQNIDWNHEKGSEMLFRYLVDEYNIDINNVNLIVDLITGERANFGQEQGEWIFDIVANHKNGIDVDKIDYIRRDTHSLGWSNYLKDFKLLMKEARVINDQICFPVKYYMNIFDIVNTRYNLYKNVYLNRVSQAIEQMICEVMISVNDYYHFEEMIQNPAEYYKLNDTIIEIIDNSKEPSFKKAQELIKRIKSRDLFNYAGSCLLRSEVSLKSESQIKQDIISHAESGLCREHLKQNVYVVKGSIGFGMKNVNPLQKVALFKKTDPLQKFNLNEKFSYCLPAQFEEKFIRIFVAHENLCKPIQQAFEKYCQKELGCLPAQWDTPNQKLGLVQDLSTTQKQALPKLPLFG